MHILAAADIHGSQHRLNLILGQITKQRPDLVILCGDLTQYGPAETATAFLNQIPVQTLAVPGNIDTPDVGDGITHSNATNIDRRRVIINGIPFIGLGGRPSPNIAAAPIQTGDGTKPIEELLDASSVLVTHVPPYKTMDRMALGPHGGNKGLRRLVEDRQPRLVLSGHIHEDPGIAHVGATMVINCSLARRYEGALIVIDDAVTATMLD